MPSERSTTIETIGGMSEKSPQEDSGEVIENSTTAPVRPFSPESRAQYEDPYQRIRSLERELSDLRTKLDAATVRARESYREARDLTVRLQRSQAQLAKKEEQKTTTPATTTTSSPPESPPGSQQRSSSPAKFVAPGVRQEMERMKQEMQEKDAELERLKQILEDREKDGDEAAQMLREFTAMLENADKVGREKDSEIAELKAELQKVAEESKPSEAESLRQQLEQMSMKAEAHGHAAGVLATRWQEVQLEAERREKELHDLRSELHVAHLREDKLAHRMEEVQSHFAMGMARSQQLDQNNMMLNDRVGALSSEVLQLRQELNRRDRDIGDMWRKMNQLQLERDRAVEDKQKIHDHLQEIVRQTRDIFAENEILKCRMEDILKSQMGTLHQYQM